MTDFAQTTGAPLNLPQWNDEIFNFGDVNEAFEEINNFAAAGNIATFGTAGQFPGTNEGIDALNEWLADPQNRGGLVKFVSDVDLENKFINIQIDNVGVDLGGFTFSGQMNEFDISSPESIINLSKIYIRGNNAHVFNGRISYQVTNIPGEFPDRLRFGAVVVMTANIFSMSNVYMNVSTYGTIGLSTYTLGFHAESCPLINILNCEVVSTNPIGVAWGITATYSTMIIKNSKITISSNALEGGRTGLASRGIYGSMGLNVYAYQLSIIGEAFNSAQLNGIACDYIFMRTSAIRLKVNDSGTVVGVTSTGLFFGSTIEVRSNTGAATGIGANYGISKLYQMNISVTSLSTSGNVYGVITQCAFVIIYQGEIRARNENAAPGSVIVACVHGNVASSLMINGTVFKVRKAVNPGAYISGGGGLILNAQITPANNIYQGAAPVAKPLAVVTDGITLGVALTSGTAGTVPEFFE